MCPRPRSVGVAESAPVPVQCPLPKVGGWRPRTLTFAGSDVVQVEFVALLGALQGALGGKEVAGRVEGLVVIAAHLSAKQRAPHFHSQSPLLVPPSSPSDGDPEGQASNVISQGSQ